MGEHPHLLLKKSQCVLLRTEIVRIFFGQQNFLKRINFQCELFFLSVRNKYQVNTDIKQTLFIKEAFLLTSSPNPTIIMICEHLRT